MNAASHNHPAAPATLACRLTPPGEGGMGLIELSGPRAAKILGRLFIGPRDTPPGAMRPGRLLYGTLRREGQILDEIILDCVQMQPSPTFIINCHGGALAARRVMAALEAEGAQPASWASCLEQRGFAGALDEIQIEAARELPRAPTLRAAGVLLDQYLGALSRAIAEMRAAPPEQARARAKELLATARFGRGLCAPPVVAVAGRPNAGKSTLANALLRYERMIVHARPGTTRDTIEELLAIDGIPMTLVDTAGIRATDDLIEREGVSRAAQALRRADLALLLFDSSAPPQEEDLRLLEGDLPQRIVPVLTKADLPAKLPPQWLRERLGVEPVAVSAVTGAGLDELERRILAALYLVIPPPGAAVVFTERQERMIAEGK